MFFMSFFYLGQKSLDDSLEKRIGSENIAQYVSNSSNKFVLDSKNSNYQTYTVSIPEYLAHEVSFIAAGENFVVKGMFVHGDSKPYVLRDLFGPEKYQVIVHELVHDRVHNDGLPQMEWQVRDITSNLTGFKDYYS